MNASLTRRVGGRRLVVGLVVATIIATFVVAPVPAALAASGTYRDTFTSAGFSGNDGTLTWSSNWIESEGDGPEDGAIIVDKDGHCWDEECLVIGTDEDVPDATVERALDLSDALEADLSFRYEIHKHSDGAGTVRVQVTSGSGGWTTLATYPLVADVGPISASFDLLPYASATTRIRFELSGGTDASHFNVDNVHVDFVQSTNVAPVLNPIGNKSVSEGTKLSFTAKAIDQDGDTVTYKLGSSAPSGASISTSGAFAWTPTEAQGPGTYTFDVIATDNGLPAKSDSETITVTVGEANRPPIIGSIANQSVEQGTTVSVTATASDPDLPANNLTFSLTGSVPAGAGMTPAGDFTWTPGASQAPGTYTIRVVVSDDADVPATAQTTFTVTVNKGKPSQAPQITSIADQVSLEGDAVSLPVKVSDPQGDKVTVTATGLPAGLSFDPSTNRITGSLSPGASEKSPYTVKLKATDDGAPPASATFEFDWVVRRSNTPPTGEDSTVVTVEDEAVVIPFSASDPDDDDLSYRIDVAPANGTVDVDSEGVRYLPGPDWSGVDTFTYVASDGLAESEPSTVTIIVTPVNDPPVATDDHFTVAPGLMLEVGAPGLLSNDEDPDGEELTIELATDPATGSLTVSADGAFTYQPEPGFVGDVQFTYRVVDSSSTAATGNVTIDVTPTSGGGDLRSGVVAVVTGFTPPSDADAPAVPLVRRSLVLMSAATGATASQTSFPLFLLLVLIGLIATVGRVGSYSLFVRGTTSAGTVTIYDADRGHGIAVEDGDASHVFIHESVLRSGSAALHPGDRVRMRVVSRARRRIATRVTRTD